MLKSFGTAIRGCPKLHIETLYRETNPNFKGKCTVPFLFDLKSRKIVCNESSMIVRMLNSEFNDLLKEKYGEKSEEYVLLFFFLA